MIVRGIDQRARVLGKTRSAETRSRIQEWRSNAIVEPHAARDFLHVGAELLAQIGHFIDECNFGRQERIRAIFDQLGGASADIMIGGSREVNGTTRTTRARPTRGLTLLVLAAQRIMAAFTVPKPCDGRTLRPSR